jgi:hypothetical protein
MTNQLNEKPGYAEYFVIKTPKCSEVDISVVSSKNRPFHVLTWSWSRPYNNHFSYKQLKITQMALRPWVPRTVAVFTYDKSYYFMHPAHGQSISSGYFFALHSPKVSFRECHTGRFGPAMNLMLHSFGTGLLAQGCLPELIPTVGGCVSL